MLPGVLYNILYIHTGHFLIFALIYGTYRVRNRRQTSHAVLGRNFLVGVGGGGLEAEKGGRGVP